MKSQIPIRAWAEWGDAVAGFVEIDRDGHAGGDASGEQCFTLTGTDISTGWTVNRSAKNKAEKWVFEALELLLAYRTEHEITFTRSRAGIKNDGAHVEQKNWARVRELVEYLRDDNSVELSTARGTCGRSSVRSGIRGV